MGVSFDDINQTLSVTLVKLRQRLYEQRPRSTGDYAGRYPLSNAARADTETISEKTKILKSTKWSAITLVTTGTIDALGFIC